jgi:hypothetical protein
MFDIVLFFVLRNQKSDLKNEKYDKKWQYHDEHSKK